MTTLNQLVALSDIRTETLLPALSSASFAWHDAWSRGGGALPGALDVKVQPLVNEVIHRAEKGDAVCAEFQQTMQTVADRVRGNIRNEDLYINEAIAVSKAVSEALAPAKAGSPHAKPSAVAYTS